MVTTLQPIKNMHDNKLIIKSKQVVSGLFKTRLQPTYNHLQPHMWLQPFSHSKRTDLQHITNKL